VRRRRLTTAAAAAASGGTAQDMMMRCGAAVVVVIGLNHWAGPAATRRACRAARAHAAASLGQQRL